MRTWMQAVPPSGPDQAYQKRFAPLGLQMETLLKAGNLAPVINGWMISFHIFDYNLDHLGPGTIENPEWKMADRTASYVPLQPIAPVPGRA